MYELISKYYDIMYVNDESYRSEVEKVVSLVKQYKKSEGNALLDIACGTGAQATYLQDYFTVTGIDICEEMLTLAKNKVKNATFINADMCEFNLSNQFRCYRKSVWLYRPSRITRAFASGYELRL